jgi:hypothetical protein
MMKEKFPRATPEILDLRIQSEGFGYAALKRSQRAAANRPTD